MTGAAGHLSLKLDDDVATFTATDIHGAAGGDLCAAFEPAAAETSALRRIPLWKYDVQLTLTSGRKITPLAEA